MLLIADNTAGFGGGRRSLQTLQIRLIEKWVAADRDPLRPRKQELLKGFAFWGEFFNPTSMGACREKVRRERQTVSSWVVLGLRGALTSPDFRKLGTV